MIIRLASPSGGARQKTPAGSGRGSGWRPKDSHQSLNCIVIRGQLSHRARSQGHLMSLLDRPLCPCATHDTPPPPPRHRHHRCSETINGRVDSPPGSALKGQRIKLHQQDKRLADTTIRQTLGSETIKVAERKKKTHHGLTSAEPAAK